ncbi:MAG: MarR family transcriptional regulator [Spirochaetales bacterium]|nr:MarR family transcriptional regulator [Spirochaetales bacterium]
MNKTKTELYGKAITSILTMNRALRQYAKTVHAEEINGRQLAAMRFLSESGECTAGDVARGLFISESGMSEQLGKLKKKGLITKSRSETDNRVVTVDLTTEGKSLVERMPEGGILLLRRRLKGIPTKELEAIYNTIEKINTLMETE